MIRHPYFVRIGSHCQAHRFETNRDVAQECEFTFSRDSEDRKPCLGCVHRIQAPTLIRERDRMNVGGLEIYEVASIRSTARE